MAHHGRRYRVREEITAETVLEQLNKASLALRSAANLTAEVSPVQPPIKEILTTLVETQRALTYLSQYVTERERG